MDTVRSSNFPHRLEIVSTSPIQYSKHHSLTYSRIFRRIMLRSWASLQADDWIMIFVLVPFSGAIVLTNLVSHGQPKSQLTYRLVLEELHVVTTWLIKACLLVLYWRILYVPVLQS